MNHRIFRLAASALAFVLLAGNASAMTAADLPVGSAPAPVAADHFPDPLHAFVWRNWQLVPAERMAEVVGATPEQIIALGRAMGLSGPPTITEDQRRRSTISVIKRNWHLLPYDQLLQLLGWTADQLDYSLREDDFLFIKLGLLKPRCEPIHWAEPNEAARERERWIAKVVAEAFPHGTGLTEEPLFDFVRQLSEPPSVLTPPAPKISLTPRYCHSYFALYGDPLLETEADPYPDGYLARLAASGVDGVWLQGVLYRMAPFPWDPAQSEHWRERLDNLRDMAARARKRGIGIWIYLNEPRSMPPGFFKDRDGIKGAPAQGNFSMCTSAPEVQAWMSGAVAEICRAAPDIAGFFTITASENPTNCWSHGQGAKCPRCALRGPAAVIAEVNAVIQKGIDDAGGNQRLIAWDWGWGDDWTPAAIEALPAKVSTMSVSEWSLPINRGGVETTVGEYSISAIGPGPRATRNWALAQKRGLRTLAKMQIGTTWELGSVPYIPAVQSAAQHVFNVRQSGVSGMMWGWSLGGYPSPNLAAAGEVAGGESVDGALANVARARFGPEAAAPTVRAWKSISAAFAEYPYHGGVVYGSPHHNGPSNPLWAKPTGYAGTMVGFPYDALDGWRAVYPADVYIAQMRKVSDGFDDAIAVWRKATGGSESSLTRANMLELAREIDIADACSIHFRSASNQAEFVMRRNSLAAAQGPDRAKLIEGLETDLNAEIDLARRLHTLQSRDSRLGFESSNQYYYVPVDLAEKVLNCRDLLARWIPDERAKVIPTEH